MAKDLYRNPAQTIETRVDDLLERMTLEEKIAQLGGIWATAILGEDNAYAQELAQAKMPHGIGHLTRVAAATGLRPQESAGLANEIQRFLVEGTRLGIPAIVHEESCAGYMARDATCFPQAIAQASTWEPELIEAMAKVIRQQMRAVGAHHALAPVLDVTRDPRWGRVEETYGEDPYLVSRLGVAYIQGLQGDDLKDGVVATAKHFIGYGMSEGGMNWAPARIPGRELLEVFAMPFEAALQEADVASVMNAYNEMDGVPCGGSSELMVDLLRGQLGFSGVVVSDYFTVDMLRTYHRVAHDKTEAARLGLTAGIDVELPAHDCYGEPLRKGLEEGVIDMALVEASVRRVLEMKFRLGLFENPYVEAREAAQVFDTPEGRALALELARKSLVLLENDHLLPLEKNLASIAVIGPAADSIRLLQGDYHYPAHIETMFEAASSALAAPTPMHAKSVEDLSEHYPPMVSILEGIKRKVFEGTQVHYAQGCDVVDESTAGFDEAVEAARKAEIAVVVVGDKSGLTNDATCGEARDRADLGLPGVQQALLEAVHATGTPVVLVHIGGRPLALSWADAHIPAILEAWLPGEEGGTAVAEVLFGDYNPGGKLPLSVPRASGQVPVYYNHKPSGGRSHWKGDYVDMPTRPLYPFGHGLSYTSFDYKALEINPGEAAADTQSQLHGSGTGGRVTISVSLSNTGSREGDEVVQLYLRNVISDVTKPVKELKGFKRLSLKPGEAKRVLFELAVAQLGFYDRDMNYVVEPGTVEVMVGGSSQDIRLSGSFEITGEKAQISEKVFFSDVKVS
jgi:beta-glucosidase